MVVSMIFDDFATLRLSSTENPIVTARRAPLFFFFRAPKLDDDNNEKAPLQLTK
jgi:hypothetical protein